MPASTHGRSTAVDGTEEFDRDIALRKRVAKGLKRLGAYGQEFADGLRDLLGADDADAMARMLRARTQRCCNDRPHATERILHYVDEIGAIATMTAVVAADLHGAAELLGSGAPKGKPYQSTLARRFVIGAAASSYTKLFGSPPGRSRSDFGRFGKYVLEIIARVPAAQRPRRPTPSAIFEAVRAWEQRQPVARRSG